MRWTDHLTYNIQLDGSMECSEGSLPAGIRRAQLQAAILEGADPSLAARLLRQLTDEIENQDKLTASWGEGWVKSPERRPAADRRGCHSEIFLQGRNLRS